VALLSLSPIIVIRLRFVVFWYVEVKVEAAEG